MELVRQKNVATRIVFPLVDADGDFVTGASSLDSEIDTFADGSNPDGFTDCTNEATEIGSTGVYYLNLTQTEMNNDYIVVQIKSASAKTQLILISTMVGDPLNFATTDDGGTINVASGIVEAQVKSIDADVITASAIAANAIGASELATDAVAEIADGVWDEAMSGHLTVGTYGQWARAQGLTGEVNDAGASTTAFKVDGFTEATDDHFNGMIVVFTSGALAGQARTITDYTGATQLITVAEALTDTPADNDDIVIIPGPMAGGTLQQIARLFLTVLNSSGQIQAGTVASDTITAAKIAADAITAAKIADGAIDANTFAAGAITASAIAADAIGASELAADAVAEIADQVWDEATAGHVAAGSFGKLAADVLEDTGTTLQGEVDGIQADTEDIQSRLPAALTANGNIKADTLRVNGTVQTAGDLAAMITTVDDFLDTEVAAILAAVDTEVASIKTKTDNLPEGIQKNAALTNFPFFMADSANHVSGATGLTVTATRSIDGGAFGACANSPAEVGSGVYKIDLDAADLNGTVITLKFSSAGADDTIITIKTEV
jgi:hypothetical protein